jgi:hypothetical protein
MLADVGGVGGGGILCVPLPERRGRSRPGCASSGLLHDLLDLLHALQPHGYQALDQAVVQLVHAQWKVSLHQSEM